MDNKPKRILVLDDELAILDVLDKYLKSENFDPYVTSKWTEAIDQITTNPPDLILLDINMPTIQGDKVLKYIRQHSETLPVIIISAYLDPQMMIDMRELGANGFVPKPFNLGKLSLIIKQAIKVSQSS